MNQERYDIGIFDSGVGGLSVVRELLNSNPNLNILYLADQIHVPYGGRSLAEIRQFALGISRFLFTHSCDAILMACNISSATALSLVQSEFPEIPVVGMIDGVSSLVANMGFQRIGVLATQGTVVSEAYPSKIAMYNSSLNVYQVACPSFVPLVEAGVLYGPKVERAAAEYLQPLADTNCEAIILGCTHYPFLLPSIEKVANELFPKPPLIVNPAAAVRSQLTIMQTTIACSHNLNRKLFLTTGDPTILKYQLSVFLGGGDWKIGYAEWRGLNLHNLLETAVNP